MFEHVRKKIFSLVLFVLLVTENTSAVENNNLTNKQLHAVIGIVTNLILTSESDESSIKVLDLAQLANSVSQTPTAYLKNQFQPFVQDSFVEEDRNIFERYSRTGSTIYSSNNWASKFDFSGVGWDSSKCGVLITKKHILLAEHYR